ncbi:MAG TPA: hypothetical protein ENI99_11770 [Sedimenticola sp.]|nr:hypothetical protein [Sedimenticola sp.]
MPRRSDKKKKRSAPGISELEADIAYFDARLSLLGRPVTPYQKAQARACRLLEELLIQKLARMRGNPQKKPAEK